MKILKQVIAVIAGLAVFLLAFVLTELVVSVLGSIPIIGAIIYWPSSSPWALMTLPAANGAFACAFVADKISGNTKPACIALIAVWSLYAISLLATIGFSLSVIIASACVIVPAILMMSGEIEKRKAD